MQIPAVVRSALGVSMLAGATLIGCGGSDRVTGVSSGGDKNLGPFISNGPTIGSTDMAMSTAHDLSSPIVVVSQPDLSMPATGSTCGAVTYNGYCTGTVVTWCESAMLKTYECANDGLNCTVVAGAADCR